jgi:hypothetical protein
MRVSLTAGVTALALAVSAAAAQDDGGPELLSTLDHIGVRVEEYYSRAQSILAIESVRVQRQLRDMTTDGHIRRLVYELRIEWTPSSDGAAPAEAKVVRQLMSVDGRPPKKGDDDACMDPEPVTPEPLMMLLPGKRGEYAFAIAGRGRTSRRPALMVDYRSRVKGKAEVKWNEECVSVSLPGWSRGRVWVDPSTHDVLRLDEQLVGMFEFPVPRSKSIPGGPRSLVVERADSTIRYQAVTFRDPDETVMLPQSIETNTLWRNTPVPRVRVTQSFSNYRRFIGDSRIVPNVR